MSQYILSIEEIHEVEAGGGKGSNLGSLLRAGFPVPPGFCVTTQAYREFLSAFAFQETVRRILEGVKGSDLIELEETSSQIQDLILDQVIPQSILGEIKKAYRALSERASEGAVSVRSSATAEDLREASFAGQYETYLNIVGEEVLVEHIKKCWASFWSARALHYRKGHGLDHLQTAMAVVVQKMVPAEASGVLFTANPVTGNREEILINASWGLGEAVVLGTVDPDYFVIDRQTRAVKEAMIGKKEKRLDGKAQGGVEEVLVPASNQEKSSLLADQVRQLVRLALAIEQHYGAPQDIEWAFAGGQFSVLQSRPITTLSKQHEEKELFPVHWEQESDRQFSWMFVGDHREATPLLSLNASVRLIWHKALRNAAELTGEQPGGAVRRSTAETREPLGPAVRLFNGYLYTGQTPLPVSKEELTRRRIHYQGRVEKYMKEGTMMWEAELFPEIEENLSRLKKVNLAGLTDEELAEHLKETLAIYERHWTLHWMMGGMQARNRFLEIYARLTGQSDGLEAQKLLEGLPTKTSEILGEISAFAKMIRENRSLSQLFVETPAEQLFSSLKAHPVANEFLKKLEQFLETYGYRAGNGFGSDVSLMVPTWREEPTLVLEILSRYLEGDLEGWKSKQRAATDERARRLEEILKQLPSGGQAEFEASLKLAEKAAALMEDHNFYIDQMSHAFVRLGFMEAAKRLVQKGELKERDEIFFLKGEEVREALLPPSRVNLHELIEMRKGEREAQMKLKPPRWLGKPDYEVRGEGAPLVLLPGGSGYRSQWARQIPLLSRRYKVIVLFSPQIDSFDLRNILEELHVDGAFFAGLGSGAGSALQFAARYQ
ncbi:MAG: hypothetical protein HY731_05515, partial [Candidatus Tectomicrobia bacterium]|nr:hypothetical protein [Candidatus Tectomicrobia bacterium]